MVFTLKICSHRHTNSHTYIHTLIRAHTHTLRQVNETQVRTQIKLTLLLALPAHTHTHTYIHTLQTSTIHSHIQYMQLGQVFAYKHTHSHFQEVKLTTDILSVTLFILCTLFMYNFLQHPTTSCFSFTYQYTYPIVLLCTQTSTHTYSSWDSADDLGYRVDDNLCIMYSVYYV